MDEHHEQPFCKECTLCNKEKLLTHFLSKITLKGRIFGRVCDQCLGLENLADHSRKRKPAKLIYKTEAALALKKLQDNGDDDTDWGSGDRGKLLKNLLTLGSGARTAEKKSEKTASDKKTTENALYLKKLFKEKKQKSTANNALYEQAKNALSKEKTETKKADPRTPLARDFKLLNKLNPGRIFKETHPFTHAIQSGEPLSFSALKQAQFKTFLQQHEARSAIDKSAFEQAVDKKTKRNNNKRNTLNFQFAKNLAKNQKASSEKTTKAISTWGLGKNPSLQNKLNAEENAKKIQKEINETLTQTRRILLKK